MCFIHKECTGFELISSCKYIHVYGKYILTSELMTVELCLKCSLWQTQTHDDIDNEQISLMSSAKENKQISQFES